MLGPPKKPALSLPASSPSLVPFISILQPDKTETERGRFLAVPVRHSYPEAREKKEKGGGLVGGEHSIWGLMRSLLLKGTRKESHTHSKVMQVFKHFVVSSEQSLTASVSFRSKGIMQEAGWRTFRWCDSLWQPCWRSSTFGNIDAFLHLCANNKEFGSFLWDWLFPRDPASCTVSYCTVN